MSIDRVISYQSLQIIRTLFTDTKVLRKTLVLLLLMGWCFDSLFNVVNKLFGCLFYFLGWPKQNSVLFNPEIVSAELMRDAVISVLLWVLFGSIIFVIVKQAKHVDQNFRMQVQPIESDPKVLLAGLSPFSYWGPRNPTPEHAINHVSKLTPEIIQIWKRSLQGSMGLVSMLSSDKLSDQQKQQRLENSLFNCNWIPLIITLINTPSIRKVVLVTTQWIENAPHGRDGSHQWLEFARIYLNAMTGREIEVCAYSDYLCEPERLKQLRSQGALDDSLIESIQTLQQKLSSLISKKPKVRSIIDAEYSLQQLQTAINEGKAKDKVGAWAMQGLDDKDWQTMIETVYVVLQRMVEQEGVRNIVVDTTASLSSLSSALAMTSTICDVGLQYVHTNDLRLQQVNIKHEFDATQHN